MKKTERENAHNAHIVAINGGKKETEYDQEDIAKIYCQGDMVELANFILSGETKEGKRVVLSHMVSPDELASYVKTLDVILTKRIEHIMDIE